MTDKSTINAILVGAKARIADPKHWCQEWHFYMKDGTPQVWSNVFEELETLWPTAAEKALILANVCRCCLDGAILLQTGDQSSLAYSDVDDILRAESKRLYDCNHVEANDSFNGHAKAMAILDASIARVNA